MLNNVTDFYSPNNLQEAVALLQRYEGQAAIVGGGLDISWREPKEIRVLIGLDRIPLSCIEESDSSIAIGSMVTLHQLMGSLALKPYLNGFIPLVLRKVATPLLRGLITLGGALARGYPWQDTLSVFLGLNAKVTIFDGSYKSLPLTEFYAPSFKKKRGTSIITEITLPRLTNTLAAYERFTRTEVDIPLLNQLILLQQIGGKITKAVVLLGARPGYPLHLSEVEECLLGEFLSDELIEKASAITKEKAVVESDFRIPRDLRRHMASVFVKRNLKEIRRNSCN